jgi:anti-sigma factor NepR-like protein
MSHQRTRRESGQVDRDGAPTYASLASNAARLAVGAELRRSFSDALREPIPDRIAELLKLLDQPIENGHDRSKECKPTHQARRNLAKTPCNKIDII